VGRGDPFSIPSFRWKAAVSILGDGDFSDAARPPPGTPRAGIDKRSYPSLFLLVTHVETDDSIFTGGVD